MPGLLDPIKEHGVAGGVARLAPQMIPGGWVGQAAGARSTDGFDVGDIFDALGDFKSDLSYILPGIGDVKGAQLAMDTWGSNTDLLTKGLSTLGILGPIATGTQAAGIVGGLGSIRALRNLDLTNPAVGAAAGHISDTMPVVRGHTVDDALSRLAPDMTGTTAKVSLIPTTSRTSRQLMVGITDIDQPGFNRQERMGRLRGALTGDQVVDVFVPGNKANAAQVDGFLMGLGETLLERIPDYAASRHSKGMGGKALSHDQVAVTAVAYETSKFDWSIRKGVLDMPSSAPDVTATWKLLKNGTVVPDADIDALGLALVQFAELTAGASHPEMALNHIGFGVSRVFLNGEKSLVELAVADWDGMPYHSSTLPEGVKRFDHAIRINESGVVVAGTDNIVTFFNKHVRPGWDDQAGPYRRSVLGLADQHPALASHPDTVNMMMLNDLERFPSNATARSGEPPSVDPALFADVRRRGIVDPLEVHWNPETGAARLVNGSGRLTAARQIGLDAVPVEITANRDLPGDRILQASGKVLTGKAKPDFRKNPTKNPHPTAMGLKVAPSVNKGIIPENARRMEWALIWYRNAQAEIAAQGAFHGIDERRLTGYAALLSAGELWEENIEKAVVAALHLRDNPSVGRVALQRHMSARGLKITEPETKAIFEFLKVADADIDTYFINKLGSDKARKEPNFVAAIRNSSADDNARQASVAYAMTSGQIPDFEAHGLFREIDRTVPVVSDRHAASVFSGFSMEPAGSLGDNIYSAVHRGFVNASSVLGEFDVGNGVMRHLSPSEIQALTWVAWREQRGLTRNFKTYTPGGGNIKRPSLWVVGKGPTYVHSHSILSQLFDNLPARYRSAGRPAAAQRRLTMRPGALQSGKVQYGRRNRRWFSKKLGKWQESFKASGTLSKPAKVVLRLGLHGEGLVLPDGASGLHRGFYFSRHADKVGQQMRPQTPMRVESVSHQRALISAATTSTTADTEGLTGFRTQTLAHRNPAFEPGHHLVISAPVELQGGRGPVSEAHRNLSELLDERGIPHAADIEQPHLGDTVVLAGGKGDSAQIFWSVEEAVAEGFELSDLRHELHQEQRINVILTFDDPEGLSRALAMLNEPEPHRGWAVSGSAQAYADYHRMYGQEYGLPPVQGIKKSLLYGGVERELAGRDPRMFQRLGPDGEPVGQLLTRGEVADMDPVTYRETKPRSFADRPTGKRIAAAYEKARRRNPDARTVRQYEHFEIEVEAQYAYLTETLGITVEVVDINPYSTAAAMSEAVEAGHLKVLSTESTGGHPFLSNEINDKFRAVHDYFGHAGTGNTFDRHGEYVAYLKHARMFSEDARGAMHSETMGQNSWLVFSDKNEAKAAEALRRGLSYHGDFSEQKMFVLPDEYWSNTALAAEHGYRTGADQGRRLDSMYGEQMLDMTAYTDVLEGAPVGMRPVFEHQFTDGVERLAHLSADGDVGSPHTGVGYVAEDGMWQFFGDSTTDRHLPGDGVHGFEGKGSRQLINQIKTQSSGLVWDNVIQVLGAEQVKPDKGARHIFEVHVDDKRPTMIAMYVPEEGTVASWQRSAVMAYNTDTIPGVPPDRIVVLTKTGGNFEGGSSVITADVPLYQNGTEIDSFLIDDLDWLLRRTGWVGEINPRMP